MRCLWFKFVEFSFFRIPSPAEDSSLPTPPWVLNLLDVSIASGACQHPETVTKRPHTWLTGVGFGCILHVWLKSRRKSTQTGPKSAHIGPNLVLGPNDRPKSVPNRPKSVDFGPLQFVTSSLRARPSVQSPGAHAGRAGQ